jgi:hypothetical protein
MGAIFLLLVMAVVVRLRSTSVDEALPARAQASSPGERRVADVIREPDEGTPAPSVNLIWLDRVIGARVGLFNEAEERGRSREDTAMLESLGYLQGYEPASEKSGLILYRNSLVQPGYNLYVSGHAPEAILMDMDGEVVHRWTYPFEEACPGAGNEEIPGQRWFRRAVLLPDGSLVVVFDYSALIKLDVHSRLLWARCGRFHHDVAVDEAGEIYALKSRMRKLKRAGAIKQYLVDSIELIDPFGETFQQVDLVEAFSQAAHRKLLARSSHMDILHTNTIQILGDRAPRRPEVFQTGNVLVSFRNIDTLATVDLEAKKVTWAKAGSWKAQHEPVLLDDGALLLFDNLGAEHGSRILELDPTSGTIRWSYESSEEGPFSSPVCGSIQRLANGNTLITESTAGRAFEITRSKEIVWDWRSPHRIWEDGRELVAILGEVTRHDAAVVDLWMAARDGNG